MKNEKKYLTLEEKIEVLIGLIQDEGYLRFNQSEDDFDDFETYDTEVQSQSLWVEGYENYILNDVPKMTFEDVIHIYNDIYESKVSLNDLDKMDAYLNKHYEPVVDVTDKSFPYPTVQMWYVL